MNTKSSSTLKIALFSNTFGLADAMGKHTHLIKKVFPQAEIFLERSNEDPKTQAHSYYFVRRYPFLALYMLEWKLGKKLKLLERILRPLEKFAFWLEAKKFSQYDIVWVQWGLYYKAVHLLPALSGLRSRPRLVFDYHGVTPPEQIVSPGKRLIAEKTIAATREGAHCADVCLVRSHFMETELRGYAHPRQVLANPLPFLPICACILPLCQRYHLENKKIILYVGRISEHKNLGIVIKALSKLGRKDIYFVVVGNDKHRSLAAEKKRLGALSRKLAVQKQLIFTGEVNEAELFSWYRLCDFFVMPSLHEGFCWPLVDAMAYSKPVIASRFGAIPETLGQAGLYFDAKDPADLAAKINQILSDQMLQNKLVQLGKEKVKGYSWEKYKQDLMTVVL